MSVRAGIDKPLFKNNAPYVEYKSGLEMGTSLDYTSTTYDPCDDSYHFTYKI